MLRLIFDHKMRYLSLNYKKIKAINIIMQKKLFIFARLMLFLL